MLDETGWAARHLHVSHDVKLMICVLPLVLLFNLLFGPMFRQGSSKSLEAVITGFKVDTSNDGVDINFGMGFSAHYAFHEITRAEEPSIGAGLYLRTANRYNYAALTRSLEDFQDFKTELVAHNIPIVKTLIPPNWEEYLFVLMFCSSLIGSVVLIGAKGRQSMLMINFAYAVLLGVVGFLIVGARANHIAQLKWARFGALLPALFAVLSFYL